MIRLSSRVAAVTLAAAAFPLAACGSDSSSSSSTETQPAATPDVARREAEATKTALQTALVTYTKGDRRAAEEQVAEAYVNHFEHVEHTLEARDPELKEKLEHAIADELRSAMKAGKPTAEVRTSVEQVLADLDTAEQKLR
jgi:uncharacterized lipoprotein YajG